jgi:hypothetical protein
VVDEKVVVVKSFTRKYKETPLERKVRLRETALKRWKTKRMIK